MRRRSFTVDNTPPPGGRALTIGFWKNWASCSKGGQKPTLDTMLATFTGGKGRIHRRPLRRHLPGGRRAAEQVDVSTRKKMASDPAYNMAAQLLAVELNFQAGAGKCAAR